MSLWFSPFSGKWFGGHLLGRYQSDPLGLTDVSKILLEGNSSPTICCDARFGRSNTELHPLDGEVLLRARGSA